MGGFKKLPNKVPYNPGAGHAVCCLEFPCEAIAHSTEIPVIFSLLSWKMTGSYLWHFYDHELIKLLSQKEATGTEKHPRIKDDSVCKGFAHACCLHHLHVWYHGDQRRETHALELELQVPWRPEEGGRCLGAGVTGGLRAVCMLRTEVKSSASALNWRASATQN